MKNIRQLSLFIYLRVLHPLLSVRNILKTEKNHSSLSLSLKLFKIERTKITQTFSLPTANVRDVCIFLIELIFLPL